MLESIEKVDNLLNFALNLTPNQIYQYIIDLLIKDLTIQDTIDKYLKIKECLERPIIYPDNCPEELSRLLFSVNMFPMDLFDYHMIVYSSIAAEVERIFDNEILPYCSRYSSVFRVIKNSSLRMLEDKTNCRSSNLNKRYVSEKYQDFLDFREFEKENVLAGTELMKKIVEENSY